MSIQQSFYGVDGITKNYVQSKYIATKQHCGVYAQRIDDDTVFDPVSVNDWDLLDNSVKLHRPIDPTIYKQIDIRVVDNPNELTDNPSDTAIVASIADEVVIVAGIKDEVVQVATDSVNVNLVGDDLALGKGTNQPTDSAILNALTNADLAIASAAAAATSETNSGTSETNAQLFEWEAEAERLTADSYATEAEDTEVNLVTSDGDGTFTYTPQTGVYSSLHWAAKAAVFNPALYALLTGATFAGQVKGITPVAAEDLTRKDYVISRSSEAETKIGDLTIGESVAVTSWSYVTTTITVNTTAVHNLIVGQYFNISGLVCTTFAPNGRWVVTTVEDTDTITFTAVDTPTGTATVSSAVLEHGDVSFYGAVRGSNAVTAYVLFDGTTTPPTIIDSFNVNNVAVITTGEFDIYFEEDMDSANYSWAGSSASDSSVGYEATAPTVSKLNVRVRNTANTLINKPYINITILGGKNL